MLRSGGVTIVFPGGDYDTFRPTSRAHVIDFGGRTGYVRTALTCDVPIVPVVSVGGQEAQIFLSRGEGLARLLRLDKLLRTKYMPIGIGFPFGLTFAFPPNLPLPTKIRTRVLEPLDVRAEFGDDPDIAEVDREVRGPDAGSGRRDGARAPVPGARMRATGGVRGLVARVRSGLWVLAALVRSGMIAPLRPDKYLRMAAVVRRQGVTPTTGMSLAAARRPHGTALVDERGSLTWGELEARSDALAVGLADQVGGGGVRTLGVLCRNHRGFVEALAAGAKLGADVLLLNTSFSGPQLGDVLAREGADVMIADEEFADVVATARAGRDELSGLVEVLGWTDSDHDRTTRPGRPPSTTWSPPTLGRAAAAGRAPGPGRAAHLRHHRHPEGRPPLRWRGRRRAGGDARPDPLAGRGDGRGRRPDVPRLGLRSARDRGHDDLHGGDAAALRSRGHPRPGRRARGRRVWPSSR